MAKCCTWHVSWQSWFGVRIKKLLYQNNFKGLNFRSSKVKFRSALTVGCYWSSSVETHPQEWTGKGWQQRLYLFQVGAQIWLQTWHSRPNQKRWGRPLSQMHSGWMWKGCCRCRSQKCLGEPRGHFRPQRWPGGGEKVGQRWSSRACCVMYSGSQEWTCSWESKEKTVTSSNYCISKQSQ